MSSLENNPKQFELVETLCAYLKINPKKVKKPIDSNFFQEIGQKIGGVIGGIGSIYVFTILFSLVPIGMTLPVILTIVLSLIVFSVVIIGLTCGIGGFLGNHVAKYLNQNHVEPNFEKKLEQLIHENTASVSIPKQPIEETDKPQLSNESSISSLYFFPQTKFLGRREDIEKIPTCRNSL